MGGFFLIKISIKRHGRLEYRRRFRSVLQAKKEAYISFAMKRAYHGDWMDTLPSDLK